MSKGFFPQRPEAHPTIYAYEDTNPQYKDLLKVGYTSVDVKQRLAQQYPTLRPGKLPYKIVLGFAPQAQKWPPWPRSGIRTLPVRT